MNKILVDSKYSHGAKLQSSTKHEKIHSKRNFIGQTSTPYDWSKPLVRNYTQPIKNQFRAGMCGGELYAQAMQIYRTLALGLPFQELSEISFYSQNHLPSGEGMTIGQMMEGASFKGLTTFQNVPTPQNCAEFQSESLAWATPQLLQDCLIRSGMKMVSVPVNIDSMAQAIRDNYFVGILIAGTNNGTWSSAYPQPPVPGSTPQWGHFMTSVPSIPACPATKALPFYQSWGTSVGLEGIQYFGEEYINSGFMYDCFTFVKHIFNQDLKFGMIGDEVKYLQVKLGMPSNTFGFGTFGIKTLAAVKSYQTANGIATTGYVGLLTRVKLNI